MRLFTKIYPRSFQDSNNDGCGDLRGIVQRLEYVASLGVDAVWICPFFKSPMHDFGYDVEDYRQIDPLFGTMKDFTVLKDTAHRLGLKLIMDIILSHTSKDHAWFRESRQSRNNEKADWYVWADPLEDGSPPNNWMSVFGGPAWTFETRRGQYYMHNFLKEQPDLNFHNPEVQNAVLEECRFWFERGIDGYRLDVMNFVFHDKELRSNPPKNPFKHGFSSQFEKTEPYNMQHHIYDKSRPETLDFLLELRALSDKYGGFLLAEIGDDEPIPRCIEYTSGNNRCHTAYSLAFMTGDGITPQIVKDTITAFFDDSQYLDNWPTWAFSNHDVIRTVTRWGVKHGYDQSPEFAKMLNILLMCLPGTICLYQGEELGLDDVQLAYDEIQDPWGIKLWPEWQGRDGCRTPMPWTDERPNADFTKSGVKSWLPIGPDHFEKSVKVQEKDYKSVLNVIREFIKLRKTLPALLTGVIDFTDMSNDHILFFKRQHPEGDVTCVFNFSDSFQPLNISFSGDLIFGDIDKGGMLPFGFAILK